MIFITSVITSILLSFMFFKGIVEVSISYTYNIRYYNVFCTAVVKNPTFHLRVEISLNIFCLCNVRNEINNCCCLNIIVGI